MCECYESAIVSSKQRHWYRFSEFCVFIHSIDVKIEKVSKQCDTMQCVSDQFNVHFLPPVPAVAGDQGPVVGERGVSPRLLCATGH